MALSFGEQPEPWMNSEAHNRHSSRRRQKTERNRKIRRMKLKENVKSFLKKYSGWEW